MNRKSLFLLITTLLLSIQGVEVHAQENNNTIRINKGNCSFFSDWGDADVDHFPSMIGIDSTTFELKKWSKSEFIRFLDEFNAVCGFEKPIIYGEVSSLYNKSSIVNVEITEVFHSNGEYEKHLVFYSCSKFGIITYISDHKKEQSN